MSKQSSQSYFEPKVEYLRPWKLFSLACGIVLLVIGAYWSGLPDWDVPISYIMAGLTYFTASSSLRVFLERRWRQMPLAVFWTWWSVDGSYALYWYFKNPIVLDELRMYNAPASLGLYGMCGVLWLYRGSLKQLFAAATQCLLLKARP